MKPYTFILDGKVPVPTKDIHQWMEWFEHADRQIAFTEVGDYSVSTVFLGIDVTFLLVDDHPPELFETAIFPASASDYAHYQRRTTTWELALEQHAEAVAYAKDLLT